MKIVIFADSLAMPRQAQDGNISDEVTYPFLLDQSLRQKLGLRAPMIIERGMRRRTIEYVLDEWFELVELRSPEVVIVHVGIVDCAPRVFLRREASMVAKVRPERLRSSIFDFVHRHRRRIVQFRKLVYVPPYRFRNLVEQVTERARAARVKSLIFVNIVTPPVEMEERSPGFRRNVEIYNSILESQEAREPWIHVIDLNKLIQKEGGVDKLTTDGIHINERGHRILARELEHQVISIDEEALVAAPDTGKV